MVIVLTKEEKRTFYGFLALYVGSSILFVSIISWLFFTSKAEQLKELTTSKMEILAGDISYKIIQAHMNDIRLNLKKLNTSNSFKYGLYDYDKQAIYTQFDDSITFEKQIFQQNNSSFYIDKRTAGHLGVFYIVIKDNSLKSAIAEVKEDIIYITIFTYLLLSLIGFYLAKLFIYPIQSQREKLNTFIKDTTHELNTPISALLLCINSDDFYNEENRNRIKLSAKKISNLYKDLTYITLKKNHKNEITKINISKILLQELDYYNQLAQKKNITIKHDIKKTTFTIDKDSFTRLIDNLISNAIKYTKRDGEIYIQLQDNRLCIKDTGIGIDKDKLSKIYERYYRGTDNSGGFGLGLNIVYSICKNYNIKIDVKSQLHKGTTFSLYFP